MGGFALMTIVNAATIPYDGWVAARPVAKYNVAVNPPPPPEVSLSLPRKIRLLSLVVH